MIHIKKASLLAFGRYKNVTLSFVDGMQIIYGGNESGKSTLQLFFRAMLYGVMGKKRGGNSLIKERERMIPWNEKYAEGSLLLEVDGTELEIYRRFGKTAASDRVEIRNPLTGEPISGYEPEQLLGMSAEAFEKVLCVRQGEGFPIGTDEELSAKLRNLAESGEEDISGEGILRQFDAEKKSLRAKDKRNSAGVLDVLYQKKEEALQERFRLQTEREQRKSVEERRNAADLRRREAEEKLKELQLAKEKKEGLIENQAKANKWREASRLLELIAVEKEKKCYCKFASLDDETIKNTESLKRKIETLDRNRQIRYDNNEVSLLLTEQTERKQRGRILSGMGFVLLFLSLLLGVMRIPFWQASMTVMIIFSLGFVCFGYFIYKKADTVLKESLLKKESLEKQDAEEAAVIAEYEAELHRILSAYDCLDIEELHEGFSECKRARVAVESYQNAYDGLMEEEEIESLKIASNAMETITEAEKELLSSDLNIEIERLQRIQMEAVSESKELEGKLSYVYHETKNPADLDMELSKIEQDIEAAKEKLAALEFAEAVFSLVLEQRKTELAPVLNEKVHEYLSVLSSGKYGETRVADTYRMRIGVPGADYKEAEYFSKGTYDQIYLSLRLALGELMGSGEEPLILDEILASFDDTRVNYALKLLQQMGERRQIFLFTCHTSVKKMGEDLSIKIHNLEEDKIDGC